MKNRIVDSMKQSVTPGPYMKNQDVPQNPRLDTHGVVVYENGDMMHPYSYRDIFGDEAYQELLRLPRVPSQYYPQEESK